MERFTFLLDPGHGGVINGIPQTSGKRSQEFAGQILYEGVFNRSIVQRIMGWAPMFGVNCVDLVPTEEDVPLQDRVDLANDYRGKESPERKPIYISIHANAGGGRGIEVFTSPGQTKSDPIATVFLKKLHSVFPEVWLRTDISDGDPDKEAKYKVLMDTRMPAILTENFFMDNEAELVKYLFSGWGRDRVALAHLAAMVQLEERGIQ